VSEELKYHEYKPDTEGNNSPKHYISDRDPIQGTVETKAKTAYF
jgi:hypothetical protein